jgi:hypothetical protein
LVIGGGMGGGQRKRGAEPPPIQKGSGSIAKKKSEAKTADGAAKPRKAKAAKGSREPLADDDALIASLISCAAGSEKTVNKPSEKQDDLDMELVAALAAEACLPSRHGGCDRCAPRQERVQSPPACAREGSCSHAQTDGRVHCAGLQ